MLILLFGSILWPVFFETLLPLIQAEAWDELIQNLFGIPLILIGFGALLWRCSGWGPASP